MGVSALFLCAVLVRVSHSLSYFAGDGAWFSGGGVGDADDWLAALETARAQYAPNARLQSIEQLYNPTWNGFVEGPTWSAWWTQNSYGPTFASLPWLPEPYRTFIANANGMWFTWIGNGTRVGLDDPHPAPDGCLCDAAQPDGAYYKQGDGNVPIHDWALEETLSAVVMQAEQLLIDRDPAAIATFLPLFERTLALIESRRDANGLLLAGDASNLLAPSYGAWLLPNGTRAPAWLTGLAVSHVAALDRVIELRVLAGDTPGAARDVARRNATLAALPRLLARDGDYFIKSMDPDGRRHGELGLGASGYIDAVVNHDAVAFGVADRVRPGLGEAIMARMLGPTVPANPVTGGPGLRPYSFVITNAGGLDDMEYPDTSWLWQFGTWVNGGGWATCEARMMLAYFATRRTDYALDSWRVLLGFASVFRMDSPLVDFGSVPYQPAEPTNLVYDMWGVPAALLRGLWGPTYGADTLMLAPRVPGNITRLEQRFPLRWGGVSVYVTFTADAPSARPRPITGVALNGAPLDAAWWTPDTVTLPWTLMPAGGGAVTLNITARGARGRRAAAPASAPGTIPAPPALHALGAAAALRALRAALPAAPQLLWLEADALVPLLPAGAPVAAWPDASPAGANASQADPAKRPTFAPDGMNGRPAVVFNRAAGTFLRGALPQPLPAEMTIAAVLRDGGEAGEACCSGVFFAEGGCDGLGTKDRGAGGGTALMIDWAGSDDTGSDDITGRQVVAVVTYNASGGFSWADGCVQSTQPSARGAAGTGAFMVGSRNDERGRYFNGSLSALLVYARALNETERASVAAYLAAKNPAPAPPGPLSCLPELPNCTLPSAVAAGAAHAAAFVPAMLAAGFPASRYETAHAQVALDAVGSWQERCAGLASGAVPFLPTRATEVAADAGYVASAVRLYAGLDATLCGYAGSPDADRRRIYDLWVAAGHATGVGAAGGLTSSAQPGASALAAGVIQ